MRTTDDGVAFGTPVAIGTATRNQNGTTYGLAFIDMGQTTAAAQLVQYGVEVINDSGASLEACYVSLKVDRKEA
jgi:hypothetical protein